MPINPRQNRRAPLRGCLAVLLAVETLCLLISFSLSACRSDGAEPAAGVKVDAGEEVCAEDVAEDQDFSYLKNHCRKLTEWKRGTTAADSWVKYLYDTSSYRLVPSGKLVAESICTFPVTVTRTAVRFMKAIGVSCEDVLLDNGRPTGELRLNMGSERQKNYGDHGTLNIFCDTVEVVVSGKAHDYGDKELSVEYFDQWHEKDGGGSGQHIGTAATYTVDKSIVTVKKYYYDQDYEIEKEKHIYPTEDTQ